MNLLRLKAPNGPFPPGGYEFTDPRTGMRFNGMEATLPQQELKIIQHRIANPKIYNPSDINFFDRQEVRQEIFKQMHAKHPGLFAGYEGQIVRVQKFAIEPQPVGKCPSCGNDAFEIQYCKTCGGQKISGYKCASCGKIRNR